MWFLILYMSFLLWSYHLRMLHRTTINLSRSTILQSFQIHPWCGSRMAFANQAVRCEKKNMVVNKGLRDISNLN